eukprot:536503-Rhodomonas_salina.1
MKGTVSHHPTAFLGTFDSGPEFFPKALSGVGLSLPGSPAAAVEGTCAGGGMLSMQGALRCHRAPRADVCVALQIGLPQRS